jgi:DNA-binding LacI/PurR family transcriptional regulator
MFFLSLPHRLWSGGRRGEEMKVRCVYGVVKEIVFEDEKKVYLIHSPSFYVTATKIEDYYKELGYDVYRLNTGVEEEEKEAERLLEQYC